MSECMPYTGKVESRTGYGYVYSGSRKLYAHRLAWALHNGSDPAGMMVRHTCHNRSCVNPEHLLLGSHQDNMDDMTAAGRQCVGAGVHGCKLTEAQVVAIRLDTRTQDAIGAQYGITQANVSEIKRRKTWRHVQP